MTAAQVLPAFTGAVLGVFPGGLVLFAAINAVTGQLTVAKATLNFETTPSFALETQSCRRNATDDPTSTPAFRTIRRRTTIGTRIRTPVASSSMVN